MANILYEDIFTSPLLAKPKQKRKEKVMEVIMGCDGEEWSQPDARHKLALKRIKELEIECGQLRLENARLKGSLRWQEFVKEKLYAEVEG